MAEWSIRTDEQFSHSTKSRHGPFWCWKTYGRKNLAFLRNNEGFFIFMLFPKKTIDES
jgi:hypothetical protein